MSRTQKVNTGWEKVGVVGVDAGMVMVGDPCYIDGSWKRDTEAAGHPPYRLTKEGLKKFPNLAGLTWKFPFPWGTFADKSPLFGMSVNDLREKGLAEEVESKPSGEFSYFGCCDRQGDTGQLSHANGIEGAGVVVSSGYGDGCYPVMVRRDPKSGRIAEMKVVFIGTEDGNEAAQEVSDEQGGDDD